VGGGVKRVIAAAPRYLAEHPRIDEPADLVRHRIVTTTHFGHDTWVFPPAAPGGVARSVHFKPRLVVNSVRAALASAVAGGGVTRLYTYHVAERVLDGSLRLLLRDAEAPPLPVHLITPQGRTSTPKVRAFLDFAAPRLRAEFARLSADAEALAPEQPDSRGE
jgi:DNA-binding transcriptional LysR family regulator